VGRVEATVDVTVLGALLAHFGGQVAGHRAVLAIDSSKSRNSGGVAFACFFVSDG
jgi:hypothetical protein